MNYPRLAMRLYNTPLVITAEKLEVIERVFRMHEAGTPKLLAPYEKPAPRPEVAGPGQAQRMQAGYTRTSDGIAIVQVLDSLVQRSSGMDALSGMTSYEDVSAQISAAMSDPQVKGILLEVDSPGGEVPGVFDLGAQIRSAAQSKPVIAHANDWAMSGGYILASAASELYSTQTGLVGSIGVRMAHIDQSQYDAKRGMVYTDIIAGARKNDMTPHEPLSDAALQWAQSHVNHTYEIFVEHVANMRGMDPEDVRATEAEIFHAGDAHARGLIDGVATAGEALQIVRDRVAGRKFSINTPLRSAASADRDFQTGADDMADKPVVATQSPEEIANALARARAEGKSEAEAEATAKIAEATATAAKAAQARVAGILGHAEADGRAALAEHFAFETEMSVEDAAKALAKAPKQAAALPTNPLAVAMRGVENPKVGPDAPSEDGEETAAQLAASIMSAGKRVKAA